MEHPLHMFCVLFLSRKCLHRGRSKGIFPLDVQKDCLPNNRGLIQKGFFCFSKSQQNYLWQLYWTRRWLDSSQICAVNNIDSVDEGFSTRLPKNITQWHLKTPPDNETDGRFVAQWDFLHPQNPGKIAAAIEASISGEANVLWREAILSLNLDRYGSQNASLDLGTLCSCQRNVCDGSHSARLLSDSHGFSFLPF